MRLLPALEPEPPTDYVTFVAEHLLPLREDAAGVVGDRQHADELYPDVLTDVAVRWRWLRLWRYRFGRPAVAEQYLRRAFDRRSQQWYAAQAADDEPMVEFQVWSGDHASGYLPAPPRRENRAVRLAAFVLPAATDVGPEVEAAIAWWHAYEAHRRRRLIAGAVVGVLLFMAFWRLRGITSGTG